MAETDIITKLRKMHDLPFTSVSDHMTTIREAVAEIRELRSDAEEHDRLWESANTSRHEMFEELRRDLGLGPSKLHMEDFVE